MKHRVRAERDKAPTPQPVSGGVRDSIRLPHQRDSSVARPTLPIQAPVPASPTEASDSRHHEFARIPLFASESGQRPSAARSAMDVAEHSSGEPLSEEVRPRLEAALGADLNQVRIHTDSRAVAAAAQLNARAFTAGSDIYFDEGRYDPGSASGQRLVTHELTHVLQHDGAARAPDTRAPDISSPDDASEREAARTADAVAAGNRVSVRPLAGPEAHALHRDAQGLSITANKKYNEADSLHEVAVEAEQGDKDLQMQSSAITNQQVLTTTVVDDARIADSEMKKIREAEKPLLEAIGHHALSGDLLADNHDALAKLGEYMAVSGFQAASLSNFQQEYVKLMQDFDRLDAMAAMMDVGDPSGAKTGDSIVKSQQLTEADQARMKADVNNPDKVASGGLTTKKGLLDAAQDKMFNASRNLGILELDISAQSHKVLAQVNNIAAGLPSREAPKEVKELNELKEKLEQIKKFASGITQIATVALGGYLGTAVGAIGEGGAAVEGGLEELGGEAAAAEAKSEGKKAAEEVVGERSKEAAEGLIEALVTAPWAKELAEAEAKAKAALGDQTFAGQKQQWEELVAQKNILEQAVSKYVNEAIVLQQAKAAVRRNAIEVGMVADKSGGGKGNKWQTLGTWYGELQAYIAQSTATRAIGKNEQEEADHTAHERAAINTTAASVHWWSVRTVKSVTSSYEELVADRHGVVPASGKGSAVSTEYRKGANDIIDDELKRLKMYEDHITQIRDVVAAAFVGRRDE